MRWAKWTKLATAPVDLTCTNVGTKGGSGQITGANFFQNVIGTVTLNPTAFAVINGVVTWLTIMYVSSTQLQFTLPSGTYTAGSWNLTVLNPDGQLCTKLIFTVSAFDDLLVIYGADLNGWTDGAHLSFSGTSVTQANDRSGNSNNSTTCTAMTYNASDPNAGGAASWTASSASSSKMLFPTSNSSSGTGWTYLVALKLAAAGSGGQMVATPNAYLQLNGSTGIPQQQYGSLVTTWTSSIVGTPCYIISSSDGAGGSTVTQSITVNDNTAITGSTSGTISHGSPLSLASQYSGTSGYVSADFYMLGWVRRASTQSETDRASTYINLTYFNIAPKITNVSQLLAGSAGGGFRVKGANFNNRMTAQLTLPGTTTPLPYSGSLTVTVRSTTLVEITLPAATSGNTFSGTADLTLTNPDGGVTVAAGALVFTSTSDFDSVGGLNLACWLVAGDATNTGNATPATAIPDRALGFDPTTFTSVQYNSADAGANNQPTISATATSANINQGSHASWISTPSDGWTWIWIGKAVSGTGDSRCSFINNAGYVGLLSSGTTTMRTRATNDAISTTSSTGVYRMYVHTVTNLGGGLAQAAIAIGTGTAVTSASWTGSLLAFSTQRLFGSLTIVGTAFAEFAIWNRILTSTEIANIYATKSAKYGALM